MTTPATPSQSLSASLPPPAKADATGGHAKRKAVAVPPMSRIARNMMERDARQFMSANARTTHRQLHRERWAARWRHEGPEWLWLPNPASAGPAPRAEGGQSL